MAMTIEIAAYQRKLEIENKQIREKLEQLLLEKMKENTEVLELYKTIIENSLAGIWVFQEGRIVFANLAMAMSLGYTHEEVSAFTEQEITQVIHPADRERLFEIGKQRLEGKDIPQHTTFRIIKKDGEIRWMRSFVKRITYLGKPALHQTYLDITEYVNF